VARRFGGAVFLAPMLLVRGEIHRMNGLGSEAEVTLREALDILHVGPPTVQLFLALPAAAALLTRREAAPLLDRCRSMTTLLERPAFLAVIRHAEGFLDDQPDRWLEAAELYGKAGLPYRQAEAEVQAGRIDQARTIVQGIGAVLPAPMGASTPAVS
jgi:hypothetical protein